MAEGINKQYLCNAKRGAFMSLQNNAGSVGRERSCFLNNMNGFSSLAAVLTWFL